MVTDLVDWRSQHPGSIEQLWEFHETLKKYFLLIPIINKSDFCRMFEVKLKLLMIPITWISQVSYGKMLLIEGHLCKC